MSETTSINRVSGLGESGTGAPAVDSFLVRWLKALLVRCSISGDVLGRIGLLFAVLCLFKGIMLVGFRRHLFDTYWRVGVQPYSWLNVALFVLFALLIGMNLWSFARRCEASGRGKVRIANGFVLVLSTLFIVFSFHEGENNHLHPVMYGFLKLQSLWAYYSLNLFFRPPFLFLWLMGYTGVYYVLARTGREQFILRITAVFAAAYTALCLRDLREYGDELMVANAFGLACLLCGGRSRPALKQSWIFLPLFFLGALYLLFLQYDDMLFAPNPEAVVLVGGSLVVFAGAGLIAWRRGFFAGWSWVVAFAGISFLLFVNTNYPSAANYRNLMCLALTLPRYFLGEFGVALALLAAAVCYRHWRPAGSLWWLDVFNVLLILLALIDLRLAQIMEARLDWDLLSLAAGEGPQMMWRMAKPYLPAAALALAAIIAVYAFALWNIKRLGAQPRVLSGLQHLQLDYVLALLILLGLAGQWAMGQDKALGQTVGVLARSSPLWRRAANPLMDQRTFAEIARRLGMASLLAAPPGSATAQNARDLNVVFILLESTYNQHLSLFSGREETQPLLSQYKDRMELFPNFYSSYAGSIQARFACLTGLYPARDYKKITLRRVGVKSLFEILHEHGYSNSIFYSSFFDYTAFRDFLKGRNLDEMYDADTMPGPRTTKPVSWGLREDETLGAMRQQIRKYAAANQKFFMTYVPAAPHNPYDGTPERFRKFPAGKFKDYTPFYLNELLYMDWICASILDELRDSGLLDKTLVVINGDHGEMLGAEGGPIGHGWALTPQLANVPLIVIGPDKSGCRVNETVGSQVDLLPTILDTLGIPCPTDQPYQGVSLHSTRAQSDRVIYLNTFRQYAVLQGRLMTFGNRDAKQGRGADNPQRQFTMQNEGARTSFVEVETPSALPYAIRDFDEFQENFLHNYEQYCRMLRPSGNALPAAAK